MWLDRVILTKFDEPGPLTEPLLAEVLEPELALLPKHPALVLDGRSARTKTGSTATYKLLAALDLRLAVPVAVSTHRMETASDALESVLTLLQDDAFAFLAAATIAEPSSFLIGSCIFARGPLSVASVEVVEPPAVGVVSSGDGFIDLLASVLETRASVPSRCRLEPI